jgi:hypothetical protein
MSNRIFQAVWDFGPQGRTEMLVLMALADCADASSAECYPSLSHICAAARASRRCVIQTLAALQADGWITVLQRDRANGSQASNLYRINLEKLGLSVVPVRAGGPARGGADSASPRGAISAPPPVQFLHPPGGAISAPLEQTIYNKGPAALCVPVLSPFVRSRVLAGQSVQIAGQTLLPGSLALESLRQTLRGDCLEKQGVA